MLRILEKIGSNKQVLAILRSYGWKGNNGAFAMQKHRGNLMADVSLILWDHCLKHNIPVSIEDFRETGE